MELLFFTLAGVSEIIGTIVGFGSSTIFLPIALAFYDFNTALVLVAILHIFGNLARLNFFRASLDKNLLLKFGLASVIFSLIGALMVDKIPQEVLKVILGLFLFIFGIFNFFQKIPKIKPTDTALGLAGASSGFLAGLIGTGGALRGATLNSFGIHKAEYIATASTIALTVDIARIPVYFSQGFLPQSLYWQIPFLFLLAIAGSFIGKNIVKKIPQNKFKLVVSLALALIGLKFIVDWII